MVEMAEGVVSAPILPINVSGRKGGFATLRLRPPTTRAIADGVSGQGKPRSAIICSKAWNKPENAQQLGSRPNETNWEILAGDSVPAYQPCWIASSPRRQTTLQKHKATKPISLPFYV
jgi:hypothetical protein